MTVSFTVLFPAHPSPTPASRGFLPGASTVRAGTEAVDGGRCGAAHAERERRRRGRKKTDGSLFVSGWEENRETSDPVKTNIPVHHSCKSADTLSSARWKFVGVFRCCWRINELLSVFSCG